MKRFFAMVCAALVLVSFTVTASAYTNVSSELVESMENAITSIEMGFTQKGTTVLEELTNVKDYYKEIKLTENDPVRISQINNLLSTLDELEDAYKNYSLGANRSPAIDSVHDVAIAAVVTWFHTQGYYLAGELLTHASENQTYGSVYMPINKHLVTQHKIIRDIRNSSQMSGSDAFEYADGADQYYAIHLFNWEKDAQRHQLIITDLYDYEIDDAPSYGDIAGVAVNAMALAQQAGYLVPFYTTIITAY